MIPLPKGSLHYFHRVMNWDHTPCADWREDQPQLSLRGVLSTSEMSSSSSGWLDSLLRGLNELVCWEVVTSFGTEVLVVLINGLSSVFLRKNEWVLVEGARGLLLLCDGMILTKSNIQRQIRNMSVKCEANSPWKRRYNKVMQEYNAIYTQVKRLPRGNILVAGCLNETPRKTAATDDDSRSIHQKS